MMQTRPTVQSVLRREPTGEDRAQLRMVLLPLSPECKAQKQQRSSLPPDEKRETAGPIWSNPEEMGFFYSERTYLTL